MELAFQGKNLYADKKLITYCRLKKLFEKLKKDILRNKISIFSIFF